MFITTHYQGNANSDHMRPYFTPERMTYAKGISLRGFMGKGKVLGVKIKLTTLLREMEIGKIILENATNFLKKLNRK